METSFGLTTFLGTYRSTQCGKRRTLSAIEKCKNSEVTYNCPARSLTTVINGCLRLCKFDRQRQESGYLMANVSQCQETLLKQDTSLEQLVPGKYLSTD